VSQRPGLIGLGAIGSSVVRILREAGDVDVEIVGALVRDASRPRRGTTPPLVTTLDELLARHPDIVIEVAGHDALRDHGALVLRAGIDLIAVSAGALADRALFEDLRRAAAAGGAQLRIPSGAIGALDAIAAAAIGGLDRVTHTTRKPARTLLPPAEAATLRSPRELFRGTARDGVLLFPESVNVAAAVSLAGIGFDRTELVVVADPGIDRNRHEVVAEGAFGSLRFEIANVPSDENPRTGRIVAMSVVRALRDRQSGLVVG
jgi:aspartate dehydrogenase